MKILVELLRTVFYFKKYSCSKMISLLHTLTLIGNENLDLRKLTNQSSILKSKPLFKELIYQVNFMVLL